MQPVTPPSDVDVLRERIAQLESVLAEARSSRGFGSKSWHARADSLLSDPIGTADDRSPADWSPADREALTDAFHRLWYDLADETWRNTRWEGQRVLKSPFDLWIYQELIWRVRPTILIETGTRFGGSAYYFASILDRVGHGRVLTVDVDPIEPLPVHPRVEYLRGSSVDPAVIDMISATIGPDDVVMVSLDSDHTHEHVLAELEAFAPMVTVGSYVIVEDTNIGGHPVRVDLGPGPMKAVDEFFPLHPEFENDPLAERYLMTFHPRGFWRRVR